jgi:hypothetical protein
MEISGFSQAEVQKLNSAKQNAGHGLSRLGAGAIAGLTLIGLVPHPIYNDK